MPAPAVLAVKQRQALVPGMGDDDRKSLAGAGCGRSLGFRHLLCRSATRGGFRQRGRGGTDPFARGRDVIVDRVALLDLGAQFEAPMTRLVHAGLLLAIRHARRNRPKTDREQAGGGLPGVFVAAFAGRTAKASANPIPTTIDVCIILSPLSHGSGLLLRPPARK